MGNLMEATDHLSVIGDKLIDVGSKSIEAAGKAQAMQAQFKQVFGSLEGKHRTPLREWLKNLECYQIRSSLFYTIYVNV